MEGSLVQEHLAFPPLPFRVVATALSTLYDGEGPRQVASHQVLITGQPVALLPGAHREAGEVKTAVTAGEKF